MTAQQTAVADSETDLQRNLYMMTRVEPHTDPSMIKISKMKKKYTNTFFILKLTSKVVACKSI